MKGKKIIRSLIAILLVLAAGAHCACEKNTVPAEDGSEKGEDVSMNTEEIKETEKTEDGDFKIIGYMPDWYSVSKLNSVRMEKYTHVNYAFAIPKSDGTIRSLPDETFVNRLVKTAHDKGVKVLLSLGGWSYKDARLSPTFVLATETSEKREKLAESFLEMAVRYGFDGLDLDWEYPEKETAIQYEEFVTILRSLCDDNGLLLTCAVTGSSSMTEAFTDKAIECFDWFNVMCYDGGSGAEHSPMSLVKRYMNYWTKIRKVPAEKVTVGVPFYERPTWNTYGSLVKDDPENAHRDSAEYKGKTVYYNGIETMEEKTLYALENAGGIMVWEMTQDSSDDDLSLICAICRTIENNR